MFPTRLLAAVALLAALSTPAWSQDSQQSLGDVARQLRSQKKDAPPPKTVITNDDLPSASTVNILGLDKPASPAVSPSPAGPGVGSSPLAALSRVESVVNQLDVMDRGTFLKLALGGANPDFPGHDNWEERLLVAKQTYVSQGFDLIQKTRQIMAGAQMLKGAQANADDPRVKELGEELKVLVQEAVRADAAFQAVILEGRDLAR